ncbi:hypothetical protein [Klebsiella pneumoniae]|uniref:hypothetical protein n=1 Tax=Klebsiella pneumoniae TaxID=573 RepID=UPI00255322F7|nr:hypothetical protein [Klebsiella pneumoniae]MDK9899847.1 hypothetical protein [Klebsiella pneumoniae]
MSTREDLVAFARHSAHDLNNTVAALTMAVELAIDMLPADDEDLSSLLERVQRNAAKLSATVDELPASAEAWELTDPSTEPLSD